MSFKELIKNYTIEEIAESFIITQKLTAKQKKEADLKLNEARKKVQAEMTDKDRMISNLLQLRFQIEDYLGSKNFDSQMSFGYFLSEYVKLLNKKRKDFAREIDINETELSQLINQHRPPNENILIRLEIHSNNSIPAISWYKLIEKEKEYSIRTNKALRRQERKNVTNRLRIHIGH